MFPLKHAAKILIHPKAEWPRIAAEPMTLSTLYLGYVAPLSAIEFVALKIRMIYEVNKNPGAEPLLTLHWGLTWLGMISNYIWGLTAVYLLALLANALAPLFCVERNFLQMSKVIAISLTSLWVGGLFIAVPFFSLDTSMTFLSKLYSLFLLYIGLSLVMKPSRTLLYTIALALAYGALKYIGRAVLPTSVNLLSQWPVLDPGTKTIVLTLITVAAILMVVYLALRPRKLFD